MAKPFGDVITTCPKCGADVGAKHPYTWCSECGEPFPEDVRLQIHSKQSKSPPPQLGGLGSSGPKTDGAQVLVLLSALLLLLVSAWARHENLDFISAVSLFGFIGLAAVWQYARNRRGATGARVSRATARFTDSAPEEPFELDSSAEDDLSQNATKVKRDLEDAAHAARNQVRPEDTWPLVNPATGDAMVPGTMVDVGGSAFGADIHHRDTGTGAGMPETNPWDH